MNLHDQIAEGEFPRVPNSSDSLHCLQACVRMAHAVLSGQSITMTEAEAATGFVPGRETWPYAALGWFAANGYDVVHIDAVDAHAMVNEPVKELRRIGTDEATIDYFLKITDWASLERDLAVCDASGHVSFKSRKPEIADIRDGLRDGWLPMITVDLGVLATRKDEFQGHIVLATAVTDGRIEIQDPGPPPRWDWLVEDALLLSAMRSPAETAGTVTLVRRRASD